MFLKWHFAQFIVQNDVYTENLAKKVLGIGRIVGEHITHLIIALLIDHLMIHVIIVNVVHHPDLGKMIISSWY